MPSLPPSVAESRKWVPYFRMMLSVMALRLGRLPSCLMVCRNSGSSGRARPLFSCLSRARLFTFQRPNSLPGEEHGQGAHFSLHNHRTRQIDRKKFSRLLTGSDRGPAADRRLFPSERRQRGSKPRRQLLSFPSGQDPRLDLDRRLVAGSLFSPAVKNDAGVTPPLPHQTPHPPMNPTLWKMNGLHAVSASAEDDCSAPPAKHCVFFRPF